MKQRLDLLVDVASMFYENDITQTEISKKLKISRPTVAALLQEAKKQGIVRITIVNQNTNSVKIQEEIKLKYNVKEVIVSSSNSMNPKLDVGILCAEYIENRSNENLKIGIGFGTTVNSFIKSANYIKTNFKSIVPIMGGVELENEALHSNLLCFTLSQKYRCKRSFFYAPVKAENQSQKQMLMDSKFVNKAIDNAKSVDIAIVGVGNPLKSSTYLKLDYIKKKDLNILNKNSAVGDIVTTFFDSNTKPIETPLTDNFIGLNINDLKEIPEVVVLASGIEKLDAIKALIMNDVADTFIIDYDIAKNLL